MRSASAIAGPGSDRADLARWGVCFALMLAVHAGLAALLTAQRWSPLLIPNDAPAIVMIDMTAQIPAAELAPSQAPSGAGTEPGPDIPDPPAAEELPEPPPSPPPIQKTVTQPPAPKAAVMLPITAPPAPKPVLMPRQKIGEKQQSKPAPVNAAYAGPREAPRPQARATDVHRTASLPSGSSATSDASAASAASWRSQLVGYLQRSLSYPPGSRGGGVAAVSFSINRAGRVLSASLAHSAGSPELDSAALELFRRPLPGPPADVAGATFSFTIPIRFNPR